PTYASPLRHNDPFRREPLLIPLRRLPKPFDSRSLETSQRHRLRCDEILETLRHVARSKMQIGIQPVPARESRRRELPLMPRILARIREHAFERAHYFFFAHLRCLPPKLALVLVQILGHRFDIDRSVQKNERAWLDHESIGNREQIVRTARGAHAVDDDEIDLAHESLRELQRRLRRSASRVDTKLLDLADTELLETIIERCRIARICDVPRLRHLASGRGSARTQFRRRKKLRGSARPQQDQRTARESDRKDSHWSSVEASASACKETDPYGLRRSAGRDGHHGNCSR